MHDLVMVTAFQLEINLIGLSSPHLSFAFVTTSSLHSKNENYVVKAILFHWTVTNNLSIYMAPS